ncbi:Rab family GTPase [Winogradskyella sp. PE311]|uniref:Rab family GTPase n=1 Tax=Winogradskyella sp. PE311 TaxID=3366943 RepID=UPI0039815CCA
MIASKKIVLLGHFGVGKSSLIRRFVKNEFSDDYKVTIGVHISKKEIQLSDSESIALIIWDLEGQDDIHKTRASYLLGTSGFIYVFDLTRPETFKNLKTELRFIKENFPNIPIKVVGNKMDLVTKVYLKQFSVIFDQFVDYFVSAKSGSRVELLFSKLAKALI